MAGCNSYDVSERMVQWKKKRKKKKREKKAKEKREKGKGRQATDLFSVVCV